ncbi:mitochondrial K+-H+ exchange-related-domain-containing protein [Mycena pura]|uniref:Mitochondrial K+-H+ exchange-related-domain-containing protein n=1 Tax=Mycena pura TaxID=153505 RepID=A0AAD7E4W3_9AGAR|nr:mitochondrial K+-H+ exchange-related-domain-containing protein [Mycena pura]
MAPLSRGAMRIVALPLLRPANATASKVPTFYSFRITPPPPKPKTITSRSLWMRWIPEEGLGKWTSHKASRTWADWGMAPTGTMRQRAFQLGERLMDRLDFEESNLKAIDLSIAPPLEVNGKTVEAVKDGEVPLLYPPMMLSGPQSLDHLRALVQERIPMHTRGVFVWIFFAVLSAPLKLIRIHNTKFPLLFLCLEVLVAPERKAPVLLWPHTKQRNRPETAERPERCVRQSYAPQENVEYLRRGLGPCAGLPSSP